MIVTMPSRRLQRAMRWFMACSLLLVLLAACSATSSPTLPAAKGSSQTSTTTKVSSAPLGAPGCHPPSSMHPSKIELSEAQGTATGVELWALFFAALPIHPRQEVKIVWRMTGSGSFQLSTYGPQGMHAQPIFGPEEHGGSNWNRPGDEWDSGFIFPVAGCWNLHATRGTASGDVWVLVQ